MYLLDLINFEAGMVLPQFAYDSDCCVASGYQWRLWREQLLCRIKGKGRGFHLHSVTPLSLKLRSSNFLQNYLGIRSISCNKENQDQIDNDVIMTSSFL